MAKRLIKEGILVIRNGKRVRPEIGKVFDLTADEIKQLEGVRPQAIAKVGSVEEDPKSTPVDDNPQGGDQPVDLKEIDVDALERADLIDLAKGMGLEFAKNIGTEKLAEMVKAKIDDDSL